MARPRKYEDRVTTAVRLPRVIHERLQEMAAERDVSVNYLLTRAASNLIEDIGAAELPVGAAFDR